MQYNPYRAPVGAGMALYQGLQRYRARATRSAWRNPGSMVMTKTKRKSAQAKTSFKDKVFNTMSARHYTSSQGVSMTHNTLYTANVTAGVVQGDTNATRDGDAIILCALRIKGFYNSAQDPEGYAFRIIIGYSGEEFTSTSFASGLGTNQLFLPNTALVVTSNGEINPKAFTVLHDEKITLNSEIDTVRSRQDYAISVPLNNMKFTYQESASALGKFKNLYMIIMADRVIGLSGVTDVGGTSISWDLVYKNAN